MADVIDVVTSTSVAARADPLPLDTALTSWYDILNWQLGNITLKLGLEDTAEHRKWVMFATNEAPGGPELTVASTIYSDGSRELVVECDITDRVMRILYNPAGTKIKQEYTHRDMYHNADDAALTVWADDGSLVYKAYYYEGQKSWFGDPADITYYPGTNRVHVAKWFWHGVLRNIISLEPAVVVYLPYGTVQTKMWYVNGVLNRREDYDQPRKLGLRR